MRVILFWVLLLPMAAFSQENAQEHKAGRPPFTLKIAPVNLINTIQQSIDLRADIPLSHRWGIELEGAAIVNSWPLASYKGESYKGLKLSPVLKYYAKRSISGDDYIGLVLKYNDVYNNRYVEIIRQGGQYIEWMFQRRHLVTWGAAVRMGTQQYFGHNKRWVIEPYFSFGIRRRSISNIAWPPDGELVEDRRLFNLYRPPGIYTSADIMLGFSVGRVLFASHSDKP